MHGNVFEWCHDYWDADYYKQSPILDPPGPTTTIGTLNVAFHVLRGGSWNFLSAGYTRSTNRHNWPAGKRFSDYGFRLVRELD
jgi:formylglycine-generating enzyme required for sulfatase activity